MRKKAAISEMKPNLTEYKRKRIFFTDTHNSKQYFDCEHEIDV